MVEGTPPRVTTEDNFIFSIEAAARKFDSAEDVLTAIGG